MSNGIGKNPLIDISKVYLQQVANEGTMDIKGFAIPKSEQDAAKKRVQDKTKKKQMEKGISSAGYTKEGLDPVNPVAANKKFANRKDTDLDNDGDTDSSDKYLHKRRKAIAGAMKKRMSEGIRDMDPEKGTAERKARLEKKRGMKMDDHPQYKKEEVEQVDENRAASRAAGGYKDDSKKQNDPSKAGFTGVSNMSIDQIRKMSARMDKEKTQKEGLDPVGKEDGDVNNDGKKDKTDKYLMNRRKAIGSAIKNKMSSMKKEETEAAEYIETVAKVKEAERQNDIKRLSLIHI